MLNLEVIKVGRQWQVWNGDEFYCIGKKTKEATVVFAELVMAAEHEQEELLAAERAERAARATELLAIRAAKRDAERAAQPDMFG